MGFFDDVDVNAAVEIPPEQETKKKVPQEETVPRERMAVSLPTRAGDSIPGKKKSPINGPMQEPVPENGQKQGFDENLPGETKEILAGKETENPSPAGKDKVVPPLKETPAGDTQRETTVAEGAVIGGGITTPGPVSVYGRVNGDIHAETASVYGGAFVCGSLLSGGDVKIWDTARVKGKITAQGEVEICEDAILVGGASSSQSVLIQGAVKGDIEAKGKVTLKSTAIIQGNIKAASIVIEDGAAIEGTCTQAYAEANLSDYFSNIDC